MEPLRDSEPLPNEHSLTIKSFENTLNDDSPKVLPICEPPPLVGEFLSSFDPGTSFATPLTEYRAERNPTKLNGSRTHVKRSNLWGHNNVSFLT